MEKFAGNLWTNGIGRLMVRLGTSDCFWVIEIVGCLVQRGFGALGSARRAPFGSGQAWVCTYIRYLIGGPCCCWQGLEDSRLSFGSV